MYLADYHMHSKYSFLMVQKNWIRSVRRRSGEDCRKLRSQTIWIFIQDLPYDEQMNFDVPGGEQHHMDVSGLYAGLVQMKEKYAGQLKVRVGAELGQPQANPEAAALFIRDYGDLDFVIGSIHNMEKDLDVYYYDFTKIDVAKMYDHYVDWLLKLSEMGDFDVMGHLTYPLRYMFERNQLRLDLRPYEEKFRQLFKNLTEKSRGIELNVSGYYKAMQDAMPPMSTFEVVPGMRR